MATFYKVSPVNNIYEINYTCAHPQPLTGCPTILPNFTDEGSKHQKLRNVQGQWLS